MTNRQHRTSVVRIVGSVALMLSAAMVSAASPAGAAAATCGLYGGYFKGMATQYASATFGARATIEDDEPALCGTATSDSSVWAMVDGWKDGHRWSNDPNYQVYAQAGYGNNTYLGYKKFAQFTKACSPGCSPGLNYDTWYSAGAPSGPLTYVAKYQSADGLIHMYSNGVDVWQTTYNPTIVWDPDWRGSFFAESKHLQSDIVGTSSNKASLWNLQTYNVFGTASFPPSFPTKGESHPNYYVTYTSPGTGGSGMDLWTYPIVR